MFINMPSLRNFRNISAFHLSKPKTGICISVINFGIKTGTKVGCIWVYNKITRWDIHNEQFRVMFQHLRFPVKGFYCSSLLYILEYPPCQCLSRCLSSHMRNLIESARGHSKLAYFLPQWTLWFLLHCSANSCELVAGRDEVQAPWKYRTINREFWEHRSIWVLFLVIRGRHW